MSGRLLILDDDEVDRKAVSRALERAGWEGGTVQASTAAEALDHIRAGRFACIVLDYRLPGEDGLEVLTRLRAEGNATPVIMLTGEGNEMIAVEAMKRGAADYLPKSQIAADTLLRAVTNAIERARLQSELAEAQKLLERQALYDSLTGLGNRNLFMRDLEHHIAAAKRTGGAFFLVLMDLDNFKQANDEYGHDAGDAILAGFGRRLATAGRANDVFYRLGGDEFTGIVEGANPQAVDAVTAQIHAAVQTPFEHGGHRLSVGVSIGAALFPEDGDTVNRLLRAADTAMYRAKDAGRPDLR